MKPTLQFTIMRIAGFTYPSADGPPITDARRRYLVEDMRALADQPIVFEEYAGKTPPGASLADRTA